MAKPFGGDRHAALYCFRRAELEARIEELIALLDMIDGDADLEDNGDEEPSVCSPTMRDRNGEAQHDLEDDRECEPSLGWDERLNQCAGNRFGPLGSYDLEADTGRIFGGCGL